MKCANVIWGERLTAKAQPVANLSVIVNGIASVLALTLSSEDNTSAPMVKARMGTKSIN